MTLSWFLRSAVQLKSLVTDKKKALPNRQSSPDAMATKGLRHESITCLGNLFCKRAKRFPGRACLDLQNHCGRR